MVRLQELSCSRKLASAPRVTQRARRHGTSGPLPREDRGAGRLHPPGGVC